MLLNRVADSFKAEAGNTDDVSAALFGREAEQGVRLLQLLDRRYAVVVTNPPYMGSKNMDTPLKKYVEKYYSSGKRDLYAAFILRCLELCRPNGRVAMVTMQSWMFLRSFAELRAIPEEKLGEAYKKGLLTGLVRETSIEALAHLGPNAFEEIGGGIVQTVMFTLQKNLPSGSLAISDGIRRLVCNSVRNECVAAAHTGWSLLTLPADDAGHRPGLGVHAACLPR